MSSAALEQQIKDLKAIIDQQHIEAKNAERASNERIQQLEQRLSATEGTKTPLKKTAPARSPASNKKAVSVSSADNATPKASPKTTSSPRKEAEPEDAPKKAVDTTSQHAWDKFCTVARGEFTVRELSLVSHNTLKDLLQHYNVVNAIECAQIECQWALMQEGKERVPNATPKPGRNNGRAHAFRPLVADKPFDATPDSKRAHLSARTVESTARRRADPNNATAAIRHKVERVESKNVATVDPAAQCDPNMSPNRNKFAGSGRKSFDVSDMKLRADASGHLRGKNRASSPNPKQLAPMPTGPEASPSCVKHFVRSKSAERVERGIKTVGYTPKDERPARLSLRQVPGAGKPTFQIG